MFAAESEGRSPFGAAPLSAPGLELRAPVGLIARDRELAELDRALWHCRQGAATTVLLRGEPGIGKSALIAATTARARDFQVVQLRGTAVHCRPGELPEEWPRPLAELSVPGDGTSGDPRVRERVVEAVRDLLGSRSSPMLLTIDDAHLVPHWFLDVLVQVVGAELMSSPLALVVALRDTPHLEEVSLPAARVDERRLNALTFDQAITLLERADGRHAQPRVATSLVHALAGNPQALLTTYARVDLDALQGWRSLPDPLPIGGVLAAAFGAALDGFEDETRRALATAAAGRTPRRVVEVALAELDLDIAALDAAVERGVVVVQRNRIDFAHPLVRAAAYFCEAEESRSAAHEALARAFQREGLLETSALHAAKSGTRSAASVVGLYGQAVRVALDRGDAVSAARYEELMADVGEADDAVSHHLARAASWWMSAGEVERAVECLDRAGGLAPPDHLRGQLLYWRARATLAGGIDTMVADDLISAGDLVAPRAPGAAAAMFADAALCLLLAGRPVEAEQVASRARKLSEVVGGFAEALSGAVLGAVSVLGRLSGSGPERLRAATTFLTSQLDGTPLSPLFAYVVGVALLEPFGTDATTTWAAWVERVAAATGNRSLSCVPGLLAAVVGRRLGRLAEAAHHASEAVEAATSCGQRVLAVRGLAELLEVQSLTGIHQDAFATAARLFAGTAENEGGLRAGAYRALAELELQRGRVPSALGWLKAAEFETAAVVDATHGRPPQHEHQAWVAALVEVLVHDHQLSSTAPLADAVERAARLGAVAGPWGPAARGLAAGDLEAAEEGFNTALRMARDWPSLRARLEFLYGSRLATEGLRERAARRYASAIATMEGIGATGWASLFEVALERLDVPPTTRPDLAVLSGGAERHEVPPTYSPPGPLETERLLAHERIDPNAAWEITMLGSFVVRSGDSTLAMPASLSATALKIVALRRRILVEELVEELWPESAPGVGMRRLRNVLWRIRVACGEILVREDKFVLLSPEVVTDVEIFRRLAAQALDPTAPSDKAAELARSALSLYGGELLPADRYADWAAAARESLSRLHVQMIELRVRHAIEDERVHEALGLLEVLMETDPYEEDHYLRAAELHARTGNRRRALATLGRAERTLSEFGIPPSAGMKRLGQQLS